MTKIIVPALIVLLFGPILPTTAENLVSMYQTDFSQEKGWFEPHDPENRPLWEIMKGVLHLKGKNPGGNFKAPYGDPSRTSFRLKLSRNNPSMHLTLLWVPETNSGHTIIIRDTDIHEITRINGNEVFSRRSRHTTKPGRWHHVEIEMRDGQLHLTMERKKVFSTNLHKDLPHAGYLFFLAHSSEYWIDDLEIMLPKNTIPEPTIPAPGPHSVLEEWDLKTVVPPAPIISAPFDIITGSQGDILVQGPAWETLVSVSLDGKVEETGIPCEGNYFDISTDGRIWYHNFPGGTVSVTSQREKISTPLFEIPPTHFPGSISVAKNGSVLYLTSADDTHSTIYRYTNRQLKTLGRAAHGESFGWIYGYIEVADTGTVWLAGVRGIYRVENDRITPFLPLSNFYPLSTTSDSKGNLLVAAYYENDRGIFRITPGKKITKLSGLPGPEEEHGGQVGIFWDDTREAVLAVHKEAHQIYVIKSGNIKPLLDPNFLSTPIALAPDGREGVYVNGDELGLQYVDTKGNVSVLTRGLVSFQPPAAGIVLSGDKLYYTGGAPGFPSALYVVAKTGQVLSETPVQGIPGGIDADSSGTVFYADYGEGTIKRYTPGEDPLVVAEGLKYPVGLTIGSDGAMYVSASDDSASINPRLVEEASRRKIMKVLPNGKVEEFYRFKNRNITFFGIDENDTLYIPLHNVVLSLDQEKNIVVLARGFSKARDAKPAADGSIYICDYGSSALYRLIPKKQLQ